MPGWQRFNRTFLSGASSNGLFFVLGSFFLGVFLTYLVIMGRIADRRTTPPAHSIANDDYLPMFAQIPPGKIQNEEFNFPSTSSVSGSGVKTLAGKVEDLLSNIRTSTNQDVADLLAERIRILCMVLTTEKYHKERAVYVKNTWGKRCTKLVFLSDKEDASLPAIKASSQADWGHVWSKVRGGFRWAYANHLKNFDWFMKADDDTFFILENLRILLAEYNPNDGIYFGHEFGNSDWKDPKSYYSGGAGYVLSRGAVIKLVEEAFQTPKYCQSASHDVSEDVEMGRCLENVGIATRDTRDDIGRQRFLPLTPSYHLTIGYAPSDFWIWTYDKYPYKEGEECCSSLAISFHYITPGDMIQIEYLVYRLQLFGRNVFGGGDLSAASQKSAYELIESKLIENKYYEDVAVHARLFRETSSASLPSVTVQVTTQPRFEQHSRRKKYTQPPTANNTLSTSSNSSKLLI